MKSPMAENDPAQHLLRSIRRLPPVAPPPLVVLFHAGHNMRWHLLDTTNPARLNLINDVLGMGTGGNGLTWDAIAACPDKDTVAQWLEREIEALTQGVIASVDDSDAMQLDAEIKDAIGLSRIELPRTIFHVAALHANIPLYSLFAKLKFEGQEDRYDATGVDHAASGLLPYEIARNIDAGGIGAFAVRCYNEQRAEQDIVMNMPEE